MEYREALAWLNSFICYERTAGWKYGPGTFDRSRVHRLMAALGQPQHTYPTIHLAGSDGKGSTAAILASILRQAGYRVGLYTSPHLENIRERISIDGEWIPRESFASIATHLRQLASSTAEFGKSYATFFELLTALAFLHFRESRVDVAVIETGLGGRLDSTNVLQPDLTIITHLSLEHTETLGDTLEQIAAEKLAICHPGVPAVVAHQKAEIKPFVRSWLRDHDVPMRSVEDRLDLLDSSCDGYWRTLDVRDSEGRGWPLRLPLLGHYQVDNALTALEAAQNLPRFSQPLGDAAWTGAIQRGFERVSWPGRYEVLEAGETGRLTRVVLDGAHTARGAKTLRETLDEVEGSGPRTLLLGFLNGKKVGAMCRSLIRPGDTTIFTKAPTPRGMATREIMDTLASEEDALLAPSGHTLSTIHPEPIVIRDPLEALRYAMDLSCDEGRTLVVAGSLYLVGSCRAALSQLSILRDGRRSAA